ncbi:Hypothetical protein, putative [Bodo saltans]|uniref:Uncharacterized protein n=1 Tax=Bodo saltans TaxID=75058 RepID=A0A0S4J3D5_BODSA|nr:Hypothetical protein, putative [Bodo saltans]|eukprot:CUG35503.1 Hypothetical protein, putative [Bodo saltans]
MMRHNFLKKKKMRKGAGKPRHCFAVGYGEHMGLPWYFLASTDTRFWAASRRSGEEKKMEVEAMGLHQVSFRLELRCYDSPVFVRV